VPIPLQQGILYGPVVSRRYGRSLGVNPLSSVRKLCSLDCAYCQYGATAQAESSACTTASSTELPRTAELIEAFESGFAQLAAKGEHPDRITIAGNGEPTMHPGFHIWLYALADARDRHFGKQVPIGLLSNGLHLQRPTVREAIVDCVDEAAFKLEVGTLETFEAMYRTPGGAFLRTLDGLRQLDHFIVQALFVRGPQVDNSREEEVSAWLERLDELKPRIDSVEIFTISREPDPAAQLLPVDAETLQWIATRARAAGHRVDLIA
jgi:wyosine [tRNA(Phe)-imidazoG37] synthetase (radical SAM superfamily)